MEIKKIKELLKNTGGKSIILAVIYSVLLIIFPNILFLFILLVIPMFIFFLWKAIKNKDFTVVTKFILPFLFMFLFYKSYHSMGKKPIGVNLFHPLVKERVEKHFKEKYDFDFVVTRIYYYYYGDEAHGMKWYPAIGGYLKHDKKFPVGVWIRDGKIVDNYRRVIFYREVDEFYKKMISKHFPWKYSSTISISISEKWMVDSYEELLKKKFKDNYVKIMIFSNKEDLKKKKISKEKYLKTIKGFVEEFSKYNNHIDDFFLRFDNTLFEEKTEKMLVIKKRDFKGIKNAEKYEIIARDYNKGVTIDNYYSTIDKIYEEIDRLSSENENIFSDFENY
ncbi:energy-coupling factor transporter transmembrane protein EcfT [Psychrilyobacter sp. S5]|uniref:energy-coupling factor transporter transmembrane protein EcfT n=1 Tax=Psychrilyobacter sp. S5 TaxID=2283384 RepID=UPI0021759D58|nr:energy-coupling factor transporter transmembrane protein EcfT [Psychrilyobacter sp. S5]MCS5422236.1 energy-coupling factor transporter transmembrane protein EcfT [Psychrilyobacter sp. S5]